MLPAAAGNVQTMTDNSPPMPGMFGVYVQVADLERSLWFYRDLLAMRVDWNDGALAVLHGPAESGNTLVIREIGDKARHDLGEAGVTRVFWQARDPADLDRAEELLIRHDVHYKRHRDTNPDGISVRDPDGLEIILLCLREEVQAATPPAWLYWYH
jgi:catechol 2,3-dioxygenase-like lactoylglutathione lyase family enzyme